MSHEAILIDPVERSITLVQQTGDLEDLYKTLECDCVCTLRMPFNHVIFLDDNGFIRPLKEINKRGMFYLGHHSKPLAGRGLIFHSKADGDVESAFLLIEQVEGMIRWRPKSSTLTEAERKVITEIQIIPFEGLAEAKDDKR